MTGGTVVETFTGRVRIIALTFQHARKVAEKHFPGKPWDYVYSADHMRGLPKGTTFFMCRSAWQLRTLYELRRIANGREYIVEEV